MTTKTAKTTGTKATGPKPTGPKATGTKAMPTLDLVRYLADMLGYELLAYISDKSTKTIKRWHSGATSPSLAVEQKLQTTVYVFQTILESDSDHVARAWLIGLNPQLDDEAPADLLRQGEYKAVVTAAKAFVSGG